MSASGRWRAGVLACRAPADPTGTYHYSSSPIQRAERHARSVGHSGVGFSPLLPRVRWPTAWKPRRISQVDLRGIRGFLTRPPPRLVRKNRPRAVTGSLPDGTSGEWRDTGRAPAHSAFRIE